jgi:Tfp pilus assembly protein PilV
MRSERGTTLLEVMASVMLFMIGIAAILSVILQSMSMAKRGEYAYTAYNMAKSRLETLKSMSFADLSSAAETDTRLDNDGVPDVDGDFRRSTAVTTSYTGDSNLASATVTVYYTFRGDESPSPMEMTTVIYNG